MDVLVFNYKTKDGEIIPVSPMMMPSIFMNFECKAYTDGDNICLADSDSVYSFAKSEIKTLRKVDSKATVYSWNKQESPTDPKYASYGLILNKLGMATTTCYYILEVERDGKTFGLYVPGYEADILREVFGFESAIDADGDMVELPCYVAYDDELDDEDVAELDTPEKETDAAEESAEVPALSEAEAAEDETEEAELDEPIEEPEEEEDSEDEEAYDEADTNEGESDEEPEEAAEETKE